MSGSAFHDSNQWFKIYKTDYKNKLSPFFFLFMRVHFQPAISINFVAKLKFLKRFFI